MQQGGGVVMQALRQVIVEPIGIGIEQRARKGLRGRLFGGQCADPGQVEFHSKPVLGIEVEAVAPGGGRLLVAPQALLRPAEQMPRSEEAVILSHGLVEDFGGGRSIALVERRPRPFVAPVEDRVSGTGEMGGRRVETHRRSRACSSAVDTAPREENAIDREQGA